MCSVHVLSCCLLDYDIFILDFLGSVRKKINRGIDMSIGNEMRKGLGLLKTVANL